MSEEFKVEIVNPEKSFLVKEDVMEVVVPAFEGEMGILKDHISIISFLKPGIIKILSKSFSNIIIAHEDFDEIIKRASIKFVTQDSMNMVYESLSTKGETFLFNMKYKSENKITKQINKLLINKQVGYIENILMADGLNKIKIQPQNPHHEIFAEVEKLAFKLLNKLDTVK